MRGEFIGLSFLKRDQLVREWRKPAANEQHLQGREQRDKEMLSPPLTSTWRFVKGIGTAAKAGAGRRPGAGEEGVCIKWRACGGLLKKGRNHLLAAEVRRLGKQTWCWGQTLKQR